TVYAGGGQHHVARSTDGGTTWEPVGTWPGAWPPSIRTVALTPDYPQNPTVYAGGTGFWRLTPGATVWEAASLGLTSEKSVGSVAASPNCGADMTLLAVAMWTEEAEQRTGVWRSVDGGVYWMPANDGLVADGVMQVAFSPRYCVDGTAYALAQSGLYRSLDSGQQWTWVGNPPEGAVVQSLVVDRTGDVYVGTSQGVWRYHTSAYDVVVNGGFEAEGGWELDASWPAEYRGDVAFDGTRSVYIGLDDEANTYTYSSARHAVSIPADVESAMLKAYVYPLSGEAGARAAGAAWQSGQRVDAAACPGDAQYLLLLDDQTGEIVENLFWERTNDRHWYELTFDLAAYAGRGLVLHFGVCNDGQGGRTGMFVDDVSLVARRSTAPADHVVYLPLVMCH
ncbi:MAG: hypothetical protein JXA93_23015, partial [Anaerolineae bacterium]|nr:hypothetical protein [Anaerolineae bacterium]